MRLTVNGVEHGLESPQLASLLYILREELGITSPKAGCQQGGCGACTVLVDGEPRRACLLPVAAVDGAEILTIEGLGTPERLAPLQQAFVHHYGMQCGFCTPGMLLASYAYLEAGEESPHAKVPAEPEGHVLVRRAARVEDMRVLEGSRVPVGRLVEQQRRLALGDGDAVDLGVLGERAAHVLDR